ncbi:MAG: hypothetical protein ACR2NO_10790 [Chloroflexota bacterium]
MSSVDRARILIRAAKLLSGSESEDVRRELLRWADELLDPNGHIAERSDKSEVTGTSSERTTAFPLSIFAEVKRRGSDARVRHDAELLEGYRVRLNGTVYDSPSAAGRSITSYETRGPQFWKFIDSSGRRRPIAELQIEHQ